MSKQDCLAENCKRRVNYTLRNVVNSNIQVFHVLTASRTAPVRNGLTQGSKLEFCQADR